MSKVLVTGGSGFVGGHVILQLLAAGHEVRTTVRSLAREPAVRDTLARAGAAHLDRLSFDAFVAPDGLHLNDWSYACMAKGLGQAIAEAAQRPVLTATASAHYRDQ